MAQLPQPAIGQRTALSTPTTALVHLRGTRYALAAHSSALTLLDLNSTSDQLQHLGRWRVFERERVHRMVCAGTGEDGRRKVLVLGGREAVLVEVVLESDSSPTLPVLARFGLEDFVGDGAFLDNDLVLLSTLHNSIHVYRLPLSSPSPSPSSSSSTSAPKPPTLHPRLTLHAPLRPVLWCTRFSSPSYRSVPSSSGGQEREVRLAGGTMWGDAYLWDVGTAAELRKEVEEAEKGGAEAREKREKRRGGGLRRFVGHKGSIFTAAFSPSAARLATGSDDRTLRLFPLPPFSSSAPLDTEKRPLVIEEGGGEGEREVVWGHEGRVWRAEWADEERVVSVGEDATCRLWSPSPSPPSSSRPNLALTQTFRSGHDGRSLWSVCPVALPSVKEGVLTGGADGGVRLWKLPGRTEEMVGTEAGKVGKLDERERIKSFAVVAIEGVGEVVAAVTLDGSIYVYPSPPSSSALNLPPPSSLAKPPDTSPAFASASTAVTLSLLPVCSASFSSHATLRLVAFSNRGAYLSAIVSFHRQGVFQASEVVEHPLDLRVTDAAFLPPSPSPAGAGVEIENGTRALVWDRASWTVALLGLPPSSSSNPPTTLASLPFPRSAPAPTALVFLHPERVLLGLADGAVVLLTFGPEKCELEEVARLEKVHGDGVSSLLVLSSENKKYVVETAGRDGLRCSLEIGLPGEGREGRMEKVDERAVAKGAVEQILPPASGSDERTYLALLDTRAVVVDSQCQILHSFSSPGKKSPAQLVVSPSGSYSYYRLTRGVLNRQSAPAFNPILHPPLHGREIRAVKSLRTRKGRVLLASAAENGVLTISELDEATSTLRTLYINPFLPSSLKSLEWSSSPSPSTSSSTAPEQERYTLFASGTRCLLCAFSVTLSPSSPPAGELRVLPSGMVLADEGEEVRTMAMAVVPLEDGTRAVVAGYSDGSIKVYTHSPLSGSFELLASSPKAHDKCVLVVDAVEVYRDEEGRPSWVVVTGDSGGLLALRDFTPLIRSASNPYVPGASSPSLDLPAPFLSYRPHPSGINALAARLHGSLLVLATGGDDGAVVAQVVYLELGGSEEGHVEGELGAAARVGEAHGSTIQGLDFLPSPSSCPPPFSTPVDTVPLTFNAHLVSSSVEQRLNLYRLRHFDPPHKPNERVPNSQLELVVWEGTTLDVADCSAQEVVSLSSSLRTEEAGGRRGEGKAEKVKVVVAGIGAEVVELNLDGTEGDSVGAA